MSDPAKTQSSAGFPGALTKYSSASRKYVCNGPMVDAS